MSGTKAGAILCLGFGDDGDRLSMGLDIGQNHTALKIRVILHPGQRPRLVV